MLLSSATFVYFKKSSLEFNFASRSTFWFVEDFSWRQIFVWIFQTFAHKKHTYTHTHTHTQRLRHDLVLHLHLNRSLSYSLSFPHCLAVFRILCILFSFYLVLFSFFLVVLCSFGCGTSYTNTHKHTHTHTHTHMRTLSLSPPFSLRTNGWNRDAGLIAGLIEIGLGLWLWYFVMRQVIAVPSRWCFYLLVLCALVWQVVAAKRFGSFVHAMGIRPWRWNSRRKYDLFGFSSIRTWHMTDTDITLCSDLENSTITIVIRESLQRKMTCCQVQIWKWMHIDPFIVQICHIRPVNLKFGKTTAISCNSHTVCTSVRLAAQNRIVLKFLDLDLQSLAWDLY